ncbi:MAG: helix-turn-helix domain-containing protein [Acidobacteriaceae bacterium]
MTLGEKLRYLRSMEGTLRNLGRDMTQQEVVAAVKAELGGTISQAYLSQIERGVRPHLTNKTRQLLAKFFKVHPGHLVDDPEGYHTELVSDLGAAEDRLDLWLVAGSESFRSDREVSKALLAISRYSDSRKALVLLGEILETPELADRLMSVLRPDMARDRSPLDSNGSK